MPFQHSAEAKEESRLEESQTEDSQLGESQLEEEEMEVEPVEKRRKAESERKEEVEGLEECGECGRRVKKGSRTHHVVSQHAQHHGHPMPPLLIHCHLVSLLHTPPLYCSCWCSGRL